MKSGETHRKNMEKHDIHGKKHRKKHDFRTTSWSDRFAVGRLRRRAFGGDLLNSSMNSLKFIDTSLNSIDNATFGCLVAYWRLTCDVLFCGFHLCPPF